MSTLGSHDLSRLRELLQARPQDLREHLAQLMQAASGAAGPGELGREFLACESDWLLGQVHGDPALQSAARDLRTQVLAHRERCLGAAQPSDVEALFELAEMRADRLVAGDFTSAANLATRMDAACSQIHDVARVLQEADERWAEQAAADEGQPLPVQIARLRATGELLQHLGAKLGHSSIRQRARRSLRAADDRELQRRCESLLGPRGVVAMEVTSFVLLLLVLTILVVESVVDLTPSEFALLHTIDGIACLGFIAEFALKWALAPRRWSFVWRHALVDLLPALPAVALLLPPVGLPDSAGGVVVFRLLRLFRVTAAARYVQALRPVLRLVRVVLLLIRGMDGLVRRFATLLDRDFLFFETGPLRALAEEDARDLVFAALRRQQVLCAALAGTERQLALLARMTALTRHAALLPGSWSENQELRPRREIAVEEAIEALWALSPADVGRWMLPAQVRALHRVIAVISSPPFGWLPLLRSFRVWPLPQSSEERVVELARRIAEWLETWHSRLHFLADLHGIVTGPQILDRVATAMMKASQRPAVRLLLFGSLFTLLDTLFTSDLLRRFVGMPLLVLGSVCLVFLLLGWWLKRIAGEASESFRRTSEAHGIALLHLRKRRHESLDVRFLASRVLAGAVAPDRAEVLLRAQLDSARAGVPVDLHEFASEHEHLAARVALLYLHFLDGALLHGSDVKTTEQLFANQALENLRYAWLSMSRKEKKRLRLLRLDDGTLLRGPFLWFKFITESVSVEVSKRITEYNRRCPPLAARRLLPEAEQQELAVWLRKRATAKAGRTIERLPPPDAGTRFSTSEFQALDFLAPQPERDAWLAATYGDDVLAALVADRRAMIREVFGMRPRSASGHTGASFNAWTFYWRRLSHGRVLLLPIYAAIRFGRLLASGVRKLHSIVREVVAPHRAKQHQVSGVATFAAAMRKIHRMKAPGLLEAIRLRVLVDPAYAGAAEGWTTGAAGDSGRALERDLDFLHLRDRARAELRRMASDRRDLVAQWHALAASMPELAVVGQTEREVADWELAMTVAWLCDRDRVRSLLTAEAWFQEALQQAAAQPAGWLRRSWVAMSARLLRHPVDRFCARMGSGFPPSLCSHLRRAFRTDAAVRGRIEAWLALAPGAAPRAVAIARLTTIAREGAALRTELGVLRAVQSLSILDVRNYRDLVFDLGCYAQDGEDPKLATSLP